MNERGKMILDIGTAFGGKYIQRDRLEDTRIAVDIVGSPLSIARMEYGVQACVGDGRSLPFQNESFDQVEIYFPDGTLLYALTYGDGWKELVRVTKPGGQIKLIIDQTNNEIRSAIVAGETEMFVAPVLQSGLLAEAAGLRLQKASLFTPSRLRNLGIIFSDYIARAVEDSTCQYFVMQGTFQKPSEQQD